MDMLAGLFVGKPLQILVVGLVLFVAHLLMRRRAADAARKRPPLLIAAIGWALYAAWEFWVNTSTPEADIRVDLLAIWPLLGIITVWAIVRSVMASR